LGWSVWLMILFLGSESRSRHFQGILKEAMVIGEAKRKAVKGRWS
jgi:hypothetical protein